jgi:tetratricopeptide (TPR) repeat protein
MSSCAPCPPRRPRALILVPCFLCVAAPATAEEAPPPPTAAEVLFTEALALKDEGRAAESCVRFRESLEAGPSVGASLNVAACSADAGDLEGARRLYAQALDLNRDTADPVRKERVEETVRTALSEIATRSGELVIDVVPKTAMVRVDSREGARVGEPWTLPRGAHVVEVEAEGFERIVQVVEVAGGARQGLTLVLSKRPTPSPPPRSSTLRTAGWITGAGALVAGVGGGVFFGLAADRAAEIRDVCGPGASPPICPLGSAAEANALSTESESFFGGAIGLFAVGGLALGTSVTLFVVDASTSASQDLTVSIAPTGLVATWRLP